MPMIDVCATVGTFGNKRELTGYLNAALIRWEKVLRHPVISLDNTARPPTVGRASMDTPIPLC